MPVALKRHAQFAASFSKPLTSPYVEKLKSIRVHLYTYAFILLFLLGKVTLLQKQSVLTAIYNPLAQRLKNQLFKSRTQNVNVEFAFFNRKINAPLSVIVARQLLKDGLYPQLFFQWQKCHLRAKRSFL